MIIAGPRTGSTNLMKSIGSAYNKKINFEPNILKKSTTYNSETDVVKYVPLPIQWKDFQKNINNSSFDLTENLEYFKEYDLLLNSVTKFNTVILLNRLNKLEQMESFYALRTYNKKVSDSWNTEVYIDYESHYYKFVKEFILRTDFIIHRLSCDLNIPINYYEDVYKTKCLINNDIKLDLEYLDSKYKLRKSDKNII